MSDDGLRAALVAIKAKLQQRSDEGEAHLFLNIPYWELEELLAEYPAESPHLTDDGATPFELETERISWHRKEGYEAGLSARGATPAIDRGALEQAIERGAVAADLAKYFLPGDMDKFVNEVMSLIAGPS